MLGDHIGESVHTAAMWSGDNYPAPMSERDRLKNTNNMWSYPAVLDSTGSIKAHGTLANMSIGTVK